MKILFHCRWVEDVILGHKGHENIKEGKVYVSHDVTNFEFLYEPFYVAKDTVVPHDERFMGYGYTRNTQVTKVNLKKKKLNYL